MQDLIDYLSLSGGRRLTLTLAGGETQRTVSIVKGEDVSLGVSFASAVFDGVRRCRNRCVFCFVDQLPRGLRKSLYVKDEDYRLSFLQGNYVTLQDLSAADLARIENHRLSPLYVSVHATDPEARGRLLGRTGPAPILPLLQRLTRRGIKLEAQAVICPGWNDRQILDATIGDLARLWPGVHSLAVVPVGLTAHRRGLPLLAPFARESAKELLAQVDTWQERLLPEIGTRFVFAADEFYVLAEETVPDAAYYEDYAQLENGVGLIRSFEDEFRLAWRRWRPVVKRGCVRVVSGMAAQQMWQRLARLVGRSGVQLEIVAVPNRLLGEGITVAGLLAGSDIVHALSGLERRPTFVPRVALQRGGDIFLDGMTAGELAAITGAEVIDTDAAVFLARVVHVLAHD